METKTSSRPNVERLEEFSDAKWNRQNNKTRRPRLGEWCTSLGRTAVPAFQRESKASSGRRGKEQRQ